MAATPDESAVASAHAWLNRHGRELDERRFAFHFGSGDRGGALAALQVFQNADGGFGRALEPDVRAPASSVIATCTGMTILRELGVPAGDPIVASAVAYLVSQYRAEPRIWPIIPPEVEEGPHAWWWSYATSETTFAGFVVNPRAAVLAHLHHYAGLVPYDVLAPATEAALDAFDAIQGPASLNDFECIAMLTEALPADSPQQARSMTALERLTAGSVERDPTSWSDYVLTPLDAAPRPTSAAAQFLDDAVIAAALDALIESQLPDGSWPVSWSWREADPEAWEEAERDWKGTRIVENLLRLRAFGRLGGGEA